MASYGSPNPNAVQILPLAKALSPQDETNKGGQPELSAPLAGTSYPRNVKSSWHSGWELAGRCAPALLDAAGSSVGCRLLGSFEAMPYLTVSLSCYSHF